MQASRNQVIIVNSFHSKLHRNNMEKRITEFFSKTASKQPLTWKNHLSNHQSQKDHVLPFPRPVVHPQKEWVMPTCLKVGKNLSQCPSKQSGNRRKTSILNLFLKPMIPDIYIKTLVFILFILLVATCIQQVRYHGTHNFWQVAKKS